MGTRSGAIYSVAKKGMIGTKKYNNFLEDTPISSKKKLLDELESELLFEGSDHQLITGLAFGKTPETSSIMYILSNAGIV